MNTSKKLNNFCKLLLVGGKNKDLEALSKLLTDCGFVTEPVTKYSDAINASIRFIPEVISIDSCGNELSAMELCISIKSLSRLKNSIVIILSDRKDELMEISSLNSGADDFLLHPLKIYIIFYLTMTR